MKNLPEIKNCVDYANSEFKSEFMDVFLAATSRFVVASDSGFISIPFLFDVPIIYCNSPTFDNYYSLRNNNIYLPRLLERKETKELIRLKDFMSMPLGNLRYKLFEKYNLNIIHNSSDEILEATKEMIELTQNLNIIRNLSDKQKKFSKLAEKNSIFLIRQD